MTHTPSQPPDEAGVVEPHIWVALTPPDPNGRHIRKWATAPFEGGSEYVPAALSPPPVVEEAGLRAIVEKLSNADCECDSFNGHTCLACRARETLRAPTPPAGEEAGPDEGSVIMEIGGRPRDIDASIAPLVAALNVVGLTTIASCSGHGFRPADIVLSDGREVIIARNFEEARRINRLFPLDIHGNPSPPAGEEAVEVPTELADFAAWLTSEQEVLSLMRHLEAAEAALGEAYRLVIGRTAKWSESFGYAEAVAEIGDTRGLTIPDELRMLSEHACPGPWLAEKGDVPYAEFDGEAWQVNSDAGSVCTVDAPEVVAEADAGLIAAAVNFIRQALSDQEDGHDDVRHTAGARELELYEGLRDAAALIRGYAILFQNEGTDQWRGRARVAEREAGVMMAVLGAKGATDA